MTYTDFIAVIDLGTSHMVGMVGAKNENGVLSIIAYDVEKSESCIREDVYITWRKLPIR